MSMAILTVLNLVLEQSNSKKFEEIRSEPLGFHCLFMSIAQVNPKKKKKINFIECHHIINISNRKIYYPKTIYILIANVKK